MKKVYSLLSLLFCLSVVKAQFPAPYCAEAYGNAVEPISSVVFNTISNTSAASTTGAVDHEDFTAMTTNLTTGGSYTISVQGNTDGNYSDYIRVFIDWNQNNDFSDPGESYDIGIITNSTGADGQTVSASIAVPVNALAGTTRMRVTKKWNVYQSPCNTAGYGQAEDYNLDITLAANCTGMPVAGTASGPSQACSGISFTISLSGASVATGIHYQWQTTTVGGSSWTNLPDDTTASLVHTQTSAADYRCVVTCTYSSVSVNSNTVSVAMQTSGCPPTNDDICNAYTLMLDSAAHCANTTLATTGSNEPTSFNCSTPNNTTWYKYTPATSGNVQFTVSVPATGDVLNGWLGVYTVTGTCSGPFTFTDETTTVLGACQSFGATSGSTTQFTANLTAGTEYYFMVDGVVGDVGAYCISIQTPPSPPATCATNSTPANNATGVTGNPGITLKWGAVAGATSYDVYFGTVNPPTTKIGTTSADSVVVNGTGYSTQYYWYVVPINTGGSPSGCDANTTSFTTGTVPAVAANDDPCDAVTLVLDGPVDCRNTAFATSVNDPTTFNCSTPNNTLWYKYTPAATGNVQFTVTPPASGDTLYGWLGVYTVSGSCPGTFTFTDVTTATLSACTSFGAAGVAQTQFTANLNAGTEYYFMVDGVSGDVGQYCISIQTPPAPPATCATLNSPANNAIDVAAPVVLKWSPVATATSYDVYFGTANPPTAVLTTTAADSVTLSGLAYTTQYYWYITPKNTGGAATGCDAGTFTFTTAAAPPPPNNDECDSAVVVTASAIVNGTNVSATQSIAPSLCQGFTSTSSADVWYTFTASQNGDATITITPTPGSGLDLVVIAYSGSCGAFTSIGCSDNSTAGVPEIVNLTGLTAGTQYYFRVYGYGSLTANQGTFTIAAAGIALPVSLAQFIGERKNGVNTLSWTTANELNNKGFEVQRSSTGDMFVPMGFVESKAITGNSTASLNYQFTDNKPYAGTTYYRLKQVDKNGKSALSHVVAVKGDKIATLSITDVYPNPAGKFLNLVIATPNNVNATIIVTDITGKIVLKQATGIVTGNNNLQLHVGNLAPGSYLLKLVCSNGCNSAVTKFVKE